MNAVTLNDRSLSEVMAAPETEQLAAAAKEPALPARRTPLYNGALECRLYEFAIVSGSMRGRRDPATMYRVSCTAARRFHAARRLR